MPKLNQTATVLLHKDEVLHSKLYFKSVNQMLHIYYFYTYILYFTTANEKLEGSVVRHILGRDAAEQAAIFDKLEVRRHWYIQVSHTACCIKTNRNQALSTTVWFSAKERQTSRVDQ